MKEQTASPEKKQAVVCYRCFQAENKHYPSVDSVVIYYDKDLDYATCKNGGYVVENFKGERIGIAHKVEMLYEFIPG